MDLHTLQFYRQPQQFADLQEITPRAWVEQGYSWIAGGTWIYSQPQPQIRALVDLERWQWSSIEITESGLTLGATCTLARLLDYPWPSDWLAIPALTAAVASLASFKVTEVATLGGNLCLALTVGSLAPVMGILDGTYEIWSLSGARREVAARSFQVGPQQTLLQAGDVLRQIHIPLHTLRSPAHFERFSSAEVEPALAIVVGQRQQQTGTYTFGLTAAVSIPTFLTFVQAPQPQEIREVLSEIDIWIEDYRGSRIYRRHLTTVLIQRCLTRLSPYIGSTGS